MSKARKSQTDKLAELEASVAALTGQLRELLAVHQAPPPEDPAVVAARYIRVEAEAREHRERTEREQREYQQGIKAAQAAAAAAGAAQQREAWALQSMREARSSRPSDEPNARELYLDAFRAEEHRTDAATRFGGARLNRKQQAEQALANQINRNSIC